MSTDVQKAPLRERVSYQAILLGAFSFLATLLLVIGNIATSDAIGERNREDLRASLSQVVPAAVHDNDLLQAPLTMDGPDGKPLTVYRGRHGAEVTALAWEIVGPGYGGDIRLILGLDAKGKILGVRVLSHSETPGLGDNIELTHSHWILGFNGLSLDNTPLAQWFVKKDGGRFDSFSGATITPRGVVQAIRLGLQFFQAHRTAMLSTPVVNAPAMK